LVKHQEVKGPLVAILGKLLGNTEAVATSPAANVLGTKQWINRNLAGATGLEPAASCVTGNCAGVETIEIPEVG
jgi:hypothetical protein